MGARTWELKMLDVPTRQRKWILKVRSLHRDTQTQRQTYTRTHSAFAQMRAPARTRTLMYSSLTVYARSTLGSIARVASTRGAGIIPR